MFNELLKNVMNLGIITEDDVKRLTAIELMMLIIERTNGLLNHVEIIDEKLTNLLEDIRTTTIEVLNKWKEDGTFDELINQSALKNVNEQLSNIEKKIPYYITPEMFGAVGDGIADDSDAIQKAIDFANGKYIDIRFGCKEYKVTKTLNIPSLTRLVGTQSNMSTYTGSRIINTVTDMFNILLDKTGRGYNYNEGLHFCGITFIGTRTQATTTNFFANTDRTYLNWGDIKDCGIRGFVDVFGNVAFTGYYINNIILYNCNTLGIIGGSDNSFYHWMINSTETNVNRKEYLVLFKDFQVSIVEDIFITGALVSGTGAKSLIYMERVNNCVFNRLICDYCDYYGIYMTSCYANTIQNSFFRGNARADDANHVVHFGAYTTNIKFHNNSFERVHTGLDKNPNAKIYHFESSSNKNRVENNYYAAEVGGLTYDLGSYTLVIIDEPSENIMLIRDTNYKRNLLSQLSNVTEELSANFQAYPQTIPANDKVSVNLATTSDIPSGCVYRVVFKEPLPTGLEVFETVFIDNQLKITLKNTTNADITLNSQMSYEVIYLTLS